jgi:magnesium and cobalt transporter
MNDDPSPSSYPQPKSLIDRIGLFLTGEPKDRDDLLSILRDAKDNNVLDAEALFMIQSVLQFSEKRVRDVMIPRIQMNVFSKDADLESVIPQVLEYGHSRFPVIEDDRSKVVGVLLAKDLLAHLSAGSKLKVGDLMRPVSLVPESKRLNVLLKEFRTERNHMAIVVDEYGMAAGLVTIEDVLEQIVGDIEDEHDAEEEEYIQKCSNKKYTIKAIMPISDFNEYFGAEIQDEEHETLGGFIVHQLGYLPKKGDKLEYDRFRFEVLHADSRRLHLIKLKLRSAQN